MLKLTPLEMLYTMLKFTVRIGLLCWGTWGML